MRQYAVRVEDDLGDLIDAARGDVPRNRWIVRAIEAALAAAEEHEVLAPAKGSPDRSMAEPHRGPMPVAESGGQVLPSSARASAEPPVVDRSDVWRKPAAASKPRPKAGR
jgi:hypothetical protein